jgi:hypothetical protein
MARIVPIWKKQVSAILRAQWLTPLQEGHTRTVRLPGAGTALEAGGSGGDRK